MDQLGRLHDRLGTPWIDKATALTSSRLLFIIAMILLQVLIEVQIDNGQGNYEHYLDLAEKLILTALDKNDNE